MFGGVKTYKDIIKGKIEENFAKGEPRMRILTEFTRGRS